MRVKQLIFRLFFLAEIGFFGWTYLLGPQGMYVLWALDVDNQQLQAECTTLERDIGRLEKACHAWKTNPFYKEKYAREKLGMARPDEHIFYIG